MKKFLIIGSLVGVVLIALGVAGFAFAQSQPPPTPPADQQGYWGMMGRGAGMMGRFQQDAPGSGMMGRMSRMHSGWSQGSHQLGPMHPFMVAALAEKLGLGAEELQAKIDAGEKPWQVAQSQGLTDEEITAIFAQAHEAALQQAVAAGVLTQEQADLMADHMQQGPHMGGGFGMGRGGHCRGQFPQP